MARGRIACGRSASREACGTACTASRRTSTVLGESTRPTASWISAMRRSAWESSRAPGILKSPGTTTASPRRSKRADGSMRDGWRSRPGGCGGASISCRAAGVLSREVSDPINARTFAKAEQRGLSTVMTICSTCTGVMGQANIKLREDPAYRERINREFLADEGLEYRGTVTVKHLLWILHEEHGLERLKAAVRRPLRGLKVSPVYGCYIRPADAIIQGKPQRKR